MAPLRLVLASNNAKKLSELQALMGEEGAKAIEGLLASISKSKEGIIATVAGVGYRIDTAPDTGRERGDRG